MINEIFIRLDADNIGDAIELSLINNDVNTAKLIHQKIQIGIKSLYDKLIESNICTILMQGCDDILFTISNEYYSESFLHELKAKFSAITGYTISIGVAYSVQDVLLNLRRAKLSGKNKIVSSVK